MGSVPGNEDCKPRRCLHSDTRVLLKAPLPKSPSKQAFRNEHFFLPSIKEDALPDVGAMQERAHTYTKIHVREPFRYDVALGLCTHEKKYVSSS